MGDYDSLDEDEDLRLLHRLIHKATARIVQAAAAIDEEELRRLMGLWVSEYDPIIYKQEGDSYGLIQGLGIDVPIGSKGVIVLKASEKYKEARAALIYLDRKHGLLLAAFNDYIKGKAND